MTHRVTNCSNARWTFTFVAASGNPAAATDPGDPAAFDLPAFGSADVSYNYVVAAPAPGGAFADVTVRVADASDGSLARARSFRVTAAVVLNAACWARSHRGSSSGGEGRERRHAHQPEQQANSTATLRRRGSVQDAKERMKVGVSNASARADRSSAAVRDEGQ